MVKVVPVFSWATCKHDILPVRRLRAIAWNQQRPAFSQRQLEPLGHPMCSLQVEPLVPNAPVSSSATVIMHCWIISDSFLYERIEERKRLSKYILYIWFFPREITLLELCICAVVRLIGSSEFQVACTVCLWTVLGLSIDIPVTVGRVSWLCRYPPHLSGRSSVSFFSDLGVR